VAPFTRARFDILHFLESHGRVVALALILLASIRIAATYPVFNHTLDEPAHIACGMEWLDKGAYTWEPQHPPLARVAAALGPYLLGIRSQGSPRRDELSKSFEGTAILYHGHRYEWTLTAARLGILPFFWVACLVVYAWGRRFFGAAAGVAAVFLFSFLPTVLAHAGLATTDMALTAFLGAAFLTGAMWVERPTIARAVLFGASTGFAVLSKFSSLVFLPACMLAALAWYFASERPQPRWLATAAWRRIPTFVLAVAVGALAIWAGYRFSFGKAEFSGLRLPAPELYSGIQDVIRHNREGHPAFLLGQRTRTGFWYFFPVALAVKTPLAFLALAAMGMALAFRKAWKRAGIPLAFAAAILATGMFSHINIGLRHILPIYVGLSVVAGCAVIELLKTATRRTWAGAVLGIACVWLAGSSLLSHPDYIPYFNELAGNHPEDILVDSDLDWGQDMNRLGARLREVGARGVAFVRATMLVADLESEHGFPEVQASTIEAPLPGWNATTWTVWKERRFGYYDQPLPIAPWPERYPPTEMVGKTVLLWYFAPARTGAGR
jgi:4-amino-4-deoxy-L-arabinose transferase-like glycosyltransferase